jgi:hypothetical protein
VYFELINVIIRYVKKTSEHCHTFSTESTISSSVLSRYIGRIGHSIQLLYSLAVILIMLRYSFKQVMLGNGRYGTVPAYDGYVLSQEQTARKQDVTAL